MNLENDLKRALHRESPPAGFAGRVMQRIESGAAGFSPPSSGMLKPAAPLWWRAAAASVILAAALGGYRIHELRQERGERAKEQVLRAMSIASEKVHYAQKQVREIGSH
ncbi:MAG TPA: hypothetical protein VKB93_29045 [Thermoanaerobaculia bacterium]|nr:hypothetical protein [Thermoanaerobaculia bacterium]